MLEINFWAVAVATIVVFVVSAVYYVLFSKTMVKLQAAKPSAEADASMPPWKILAELLRSLVLATVLAYLLAVLGTTGVMNAMVLGIWLWVGFPVVLLAGSVVHENVPWKLAAIHAGDWLVKLLIVIVIISVWK